MRTLLFSVAATAVLASAAVGLSSDANAASRHPRYRTPAPAPIVRQDPYGAYNALGAPGISPYQGRRDVHPLSGTPRWNAAGGAA